MTPILELDGRFHDPVAAATFPTLDLRFRNQRHAQRIGLGDLDERAWKAHFGRFESLPGNLTEPLAQRYHGHQFQHYNMDLGDGRGFVFAQLVESGTGRLLDLGTKGSGTTRWSRGGDGRLTLKGGVREVLATEMLEARGVDTSKTFSLFETGESLHRGDEPSPTRACVMVRLSHSHIRFGTFQRQAYLGDRDALQVLVDYCGRHYYPSILSLEDQERTTELLGLVAEKNADLLAQWHLAGFVHGVLNTDNMNITGESFDYGPYRFLPTFDPSFTAAYFDHTGLYAFGRQAETLGWNLERLAECLALICPVEPLVKALGRYRKALRPALHRNLLRRLNLKSHSTTRDSELGGSMYTFLQESQVGYEDFFFDFFGGGSDRALSGKRKAFYAGASFDRLCSALEEHEPADPRRVEHVYFQQSDPCGMLVDEIEDLWDPIARDDDWSVFHAKLKQIDGCREALNTSATDSKPNEGSVV